MCREKERRAGRRSPGKEIQRDGKTLERERTAKKAKCRKRDERRKGKGGKRKRESGRS